MLRQPGEDGETAYNAASANIERYDNGFLLVIASTGSQVWVPDSEVRQAHWTMTRDTDPAPPFAAE